MIKINLLPQEMAGRAAKSTSSSDPGQALVVLVLVIALIVNGGLFYFVNKAHTDAKKRLEVAQADAKKVADELKSAKIEFDDKTADLESVRARLRVAEKLDPPNRLLWSRKLNALPLLVPPGIFLTQIEVTQKVTEVQTEESVKQMNDWAKTKKGPQPLPVRVPVINSTMILKGLAYVEQGNPNQRLEQINLFNMNLRTKKVKLPFDAEPSSFMDEFSPTIIYAPTSTSTVDERSVSNFTFTLNAKPMRID